jgi:acyl-CoA synthetase (AMP-forming)/AMP-acid ligase II
VGEDGNDVAPGEFGEVAIRGKHIMKEYWRQPEATAQAIRDGWFFSGDGATIDEDGFLYIQDRIKDMIISGGENVYPAEVEGVLLQHPDIIDAAVIGQPSAKWGESGLAIVRRKDEALEAAAVLAFVSDKLARFKQPVAVEFVDEVPRNPSGKILKRVLREQFPGPAAE